MPKPRPLLGGAQLTALLGDGSVLSQYNPTFRERATDAIRSLLFSDDREGQRKAERLSNVLETVTPYGVATGVDDASESFGQGDYATAGTMFAMAGLPGPSPKPKGIRAFHGSPHSFDKFSMDKIGTGEGAQAYGHGLYFAENEGVARGYRDALKPGSGVGPEDTASRVLDLHGGDRDAAMASLRETIDRAFANGSDYAEVQRLMQAKNILNTTPHVASGSMYEVNINADPDSFLDWDKPLSEQPGVLAKIGKVTPTATGEKLYRAVTDRFDSVPAMGGFPALKGDQTKATKALREAGIPGIKYLDAGSRGMNPPSVKPNNGQYEVYWGNDPRPVDTFPTKEAAEAAAREIDGRSRNYVVFDDKLVSIVRKYGIAGASAMLGYNVLSGMSEAQAAQLKEAERK